MLFTLDMACAQPAWTGRDRVSDEWEGSNTRREASCLHEVVLAEDEAKYGAHGDARGCAQVALDESTLPEEVATSELGDQGSMRVNRVAR